VYLVEKKVRNEQREKNESKRGRVDLKTTTTNTWTNPYCSPCCSLRGGACNPMFAVSRGFFHEQKLVIYS